MPTSAEFKPSSALGTLWGGGITLVTLLLGAALIYKALQMDVRLAQLFPFIAGFLFLSLAAVYAYWTYGCNSLSYVVDRNALSIRWGGIRQVVPLASIERLIQGAEGESPHVEGVNWPGHHVGFGAAEELGDILFYSAHRVPQELVYVQTPETTYAISVPDAVAFAQAVQSNQQRGALFEQRQAVHRWGIANQTFWLDSNARFLAFVLVAAFFVVLAYVLQTYPGLSQSVPLRFPSLSGIVRVADKSELLDIPRSAAGFLALDLVLAILLHSWERMVAYVLLLAGIAIQVMLLVAAFVAVA